MSDRFAVESNRRVVGVAIRVPGGFKFFSSDRDYFPIDGKTFPKIRTMARAVDRIGERAMRGLSNDNDRPDGGPPSPAA